MMYYHSKFGKSKIVFISLSLTRKRTHTHTREKEKLMKIINIKLIKSEVKYFTYIKEI